MPTKQTRARVIVYGADWCYDTTSCRRHLDQCGVPHRYVNIEEHPKAEAWVKEQNDGAARKPTVKIGREVLAVPKPAELNKALLKRRLTTKKTLEELNAERAARGLPPH